MNDTLPSQPLEALIKSVTKLEQATSSQPEAVKLDAVAWRKLCEIIENPPKANNALKDLMRNT